MNIRRGFVSNSSSSSFVVAFPKKPETVVEMKELLFKDVENYPSPYGSESWSATEVAEIVLRDMAEPLSDEEAAEAMAAGWWGNFKGNEELAQLTEPNPARPWATTDYDLLDKLQKEDAMAVVKAMHKKYPGWKLYKFHYSDNDGSLMSAMEHGGLFDLLPHEIISHH